MSVSFYLDASDNAAFAAAALSLAKATLSIFLGKRKWSSGVSVLNQMLSESRKRYRGRAISSLGTGVQTDTLPFNMM